MTSLKMAARHEIDVSGLGARIGALPGIGRVREAAAAAGVDAYLVGGSVRDALLGIERADLDVVVDGDHLALAGRLGGDVHAHGRFLTATVATADGTVDVAAARAETYTHPGALPFVRRARLADDLARRDFTVNALAFPLAHDPRLIDPHGGVDDLRRGLLRVLHPRSVVDDPTRALRAARYGARLGFGPEPETLTLLRRADLGTVSVDRAEAELRRLAREPRARLGFELLAAWGLLELGARELELIEAVAELETREPWRALADVADVVLAVVRGRVGGVEALARTDPARPSDAAAAARGRSGVELVLARALGASWLDRYVSDWRHVRLEISGRDLLAAGVDEGPAVGHGLARALEAKLDGEVANRDEELRVALAAAAIRHPER